MELNAQVGIVLGCLAGVLLIFCTAWMTYCSVMSPRAQKAYFQRNGGAPSETILGV